MDTSISSEKLQIERKQFYFDLKENPRGRFLRITEEVAGRRDSIIIPATGLEQFRRIIDAMIRATDEEPLGQPRTSP
ncbi:MAG: PUR family DNA/RNA-binding protein [Kiritimatiellae bacterium]|nr:PUR family DNA/RNA-binding protein [Kiritimatiellia bacterium]MDW8458920.1 PUR family DNA/RNA-binding protein [Verrucomicrobiota bacterium]